MAVRLVRTSTYAWSGSSPAIARIENEKTNRLRKIEMVEFATKQMP